MVFIDIESSGSMVFKHIESSRKHRFHTYEQPANAWFSYILRGRPKLPTYLQLFLKVGVQVRQVLRQRQSVGQLDPTSGGRGHGVSLPYFQGVAGWDLEIFSCSLHKTTDFYASLRYRAHMDADIRQAQMDPDIQVNKDPQLQDHMDADIQANKDPVLQAHMDPIQANKDPVLQAHMDPAIQANKDPVLQADMDLDIQANKGTEMLECSVC
ncbi:hypothetical protein BGX38DRAFT_358884 [Terfezia claveryi]|nr:hypothetical protein BGX38DRAFT_358884 [Terfezia claveryi]